MLRRGILPIVKISRYTDPDGLKYKFPSGTALLVCDKNIYPGRLFLITAKHVIEKDSATDCMINFSRIEDKEKKIVSSAKKYTIYKKEWKFHKFDHVEIAGIDTAFYSYDIAIAEIFLRRIQIDGETIWHEALSLDRFTTKGLQDYDSVKILAFPFMNKFNWERGLTMGDLEEDRGIQRFSTRKSINFENNKSVMDLNEIYIENPKFRPGYSGGLVFYIYNSNFNFSGVSMGMTNVVKRSNKQYCLGFYIKAESIREALFYNFK
jgi:hypothetical protein